MRTIDIIFENDLRFAGIEDAGTGEPLNFGEWIVKEDGVRALRFRISGHGLDQMFNQYQTSSDGVTKTFDVNTGELLKTETVTSIIVHDAALLKGTPGKP